MCATWTMRHTVTACPAAMYVLAADSVTVAEAVTAPLTMAVTSFSESQQQDVDCAPTAPSPQYLRAARTGAVSASGTEASGTHKAAKAVSHVSACTEKV